MHTTRQKGLRNRTRTGRSTYSIMGKAASRDRYGKFDNGVRRSDDFIAGVRLSFALGQSTTPRVA